MWSNITYPTSSSAFCLAYVLTHNLLNFTTSSDSLIGSAESDVIIDKP